MHEQTFAGQMMRRCLVLARRGRAWVAPNPMVGAVVVKDDEIVGEGYHKRFGGPHAEVNALRRAGDQARGATLYVSLEPCCHQGKTPPCTEAIIDAGITRVVAAMLDPNPMVAGKGFARLREAGIDVVVGVLEDEAVSLNQPYLKKAATGDVWVTLKIAQSLDGRIASITGHSQWISGEKSMRFAHMLRATHDAVLVGSGTVHLDDPQLTVRHVAGRNPVRVVLDTHFGIPEGCRLLNSQDAARTIVFGSPSDGKLPIWASKPNVEAVLVPRDSQGRTDLRVVLNELGRRGICSLMVEGGSRIWTSFLDLGLVDKIEMVVAPIILGHGIDSIQDLGILKVHDAIRLEPFRWRRIGTDLHIAARIVSKGND